MSSIFLEHSLHPKKNQRTIFVSSKGHFAQENVWMDLYLDIGPNDLIKDAGFLHSGCDLYVPYASLLCQWLVEKNLEEAQNFSAIDFYEYFKQSLEFLDLQGQGLTPLVMLPLHLLRMAISDYLGRPKSLSQLTHNDESDLICRCFGVYGKQILKLLKDKPDLKLNEITINLKAGGGCTSCLEDIEEILEANDKIIKPLPKMEKVEENLLLKISQVLKVWKKHSVLLNKFIQDYNLDENHLQLGFEGQKDGTLFFVLHYEGHDLKLLHPSLKSYLVDNLPKDKSIFVR